MINVFNSPIEASTLDEFTEEHSEKGTIFEKRKRLPKVEYTLDGRKVLDGVLTDEQTPNSLWTTTISRGVANDWKSKAAGGPFYKIKYFASTVTYEVKSFIHRSIRNYGTHILLVINFCLGLTVFRLYKIL